MNLVQIRFGASENYGKRQVEDKSRKADYSQAEITTPALRFRLHHFCVIEILADLFSVRQIFIPDGRKRDKNILRVKKRKMH